MPAVFIQSKTTSAHAVDHSCTTWAPLLCWLEASWERSLIQSQTGLIATGTIQANLTLKKGPYARKEAVEQAIFSRQMEASPPQIALCLSFRPDLTSFHSLIESNWDQREQRHKACAAWLHKVLKECHCSLTLRMFPPTFPEGLLCCPLLIPLSSHR